MMGHRWTVTLIMVSKFGHGLFIHVQGAHLHVQFDLECLA